MECLLFTLMNFSNGSTAPVRRQREQSLAGRRQRVIDLSSSPFRRSAVDGQVSMYSGDPPEQLAEVRYAPPPPFAREI